MDCCICTAVDNSYICDACHVFLHPLLIGGTARRVDKNGNASIYPASYFANFTTHRTALNSLRLITSQKEGMEEMKEKLEYLGGLVNDFRNLLDTNVQVLAGKNGTPKPAHKDILAERSNRLKTILVVQETDKITLPDLSEEELTCLLDFIYKGELSKALFKKHLYSLSLASHHYGIPFLAKSCEKELMKGLTTKNALQVLKISHTCSMLKSKKFVLDFISNKMEDILFTTEFEVFSTQNPQLVVEISRANCTHHTKRQKTDNNPK